MGSCSERTTIEHKFELSSTIVSRFLTQQNSGQFNLSKLRGRPFDFWGGRGEWVISEKKIPADWFRVRKNFCKEITGGKNLLHWKNYLSWLIILAKNLTLHRCMSGKKNSITRGLEEQKSHPNQIAHITHQKWNGRPLKALSLVLIYGALPEFICHDCLSNPGPIKV